MKNNREYIKKEILQELEDLNSSLTKLKGENPYGLPSNYFEGLEHEILQQVPEKLPYKVKDAYFENLASSIQDRINIEDTRSAPRIKRMNTIAGIAASIIVVCAIFFLIPKTNKNDTHSLAEAELFLEENIVDLDLEEIIDLEMAENYKQIDLQQISTEEMEMYIEENITEFNIEELSDLL